MILATHHNKGLSLLTYVIAVILAGSLIACGSANSEQKSETSKVEAPVEESSAEEPSAAATEEASAEKTPAEESIKEPVEDSVQKSSSSTSDNAVPIEPIPNTELPDFHALLSLKPNDIATTLSNFEVVNGDTMGFPEGAENIFLSDPKLTERKNEQVIWQIFEQTDYACYFLLYGDKIDNTSEENLSADDLRNGFVPDSIDLFIETDVEPTCENFVGIIDQILPCNRLVAMLHPETVNPDFEGEYFCYGATEEGYAINAIPGVNDIPGVWSIQCIIFTPGARADQFIGSMESYASNESFKESGQDYPGTIIIRESE